METSERLRTATSNTSISLPEDSPAKTLVAPESGAGSPQEPEVDCGSSTPDLLGSFDPDSYLLRTSQGSLLTNQCVEYSGTFPRSGLMLNGKVYQRVPLVPLTYATAFGYLPTPDKSLGAMLGGITIWADAQSCFNKETTGFRPSGARIGSSLRWCPEFIREALRTGGCVNPAWLEALMGFPENWLTLPTEPTETPWSRK